MMHIYVSDRDPRDVGAIASSMFDVNVGGNHLVIWVNEHGCGVAGTVRWSPLLSAAAKLAVALHVHRLTRGNVLIERALESALATQGYTLKAVGQ